MRHWTIFFIGASLPIPRSHPRPGVILLDLNLPGTDGREVLSELKKTDHLKTIPVIILTTSTDDRDIQGCYRMGANSYVKKPVDLEEFMRSDSAAEGLLVRGSDPA